MNDLIIIALPNEAPNLVNHANVFFTGVGKINAAMTVAKLVEKYKPKRIFNFGTAGGITTTGFVKCTQFVQRDMICMPLMENPGETPFETEHRIVFDTNGATCSTGDNFVTNPDLDIAADLVDMEAYAIAKICRSQNISFVCYKYITDNADNLAGTTWEEQVAKGESHYITILKQYQLL
jgi:adenosylhomocysteine nucleosidase